MKVIYRMCDIPSSNPSPIFQDDKPRLNKFCLKSFIKAFEDVKYNITFLCDYCTPQTIEMIQKLCPKGEIIQTAIGINETMLKAYEIAKSQDDDILFQECDYYWLPNTGKILANTIKEFELISPYDHPNFYTDHILHKPDCKVFLFYGQHWRSTERNTMTFAMTKRVLERGYDILRKWGYLDGDVWYELKNINHPLYVPIPTFATHMVKDYLSPGIDWKELWKTQI